MLVHIADLSYNHPEDVLILPENAGVPPTCSITWPTSNIRIRSHTDLRIHADAEDMDGIIAKVEFFEGTQKLGEDTESPYTFTWIDIPEGIYSLTARATDSNDLTAVSPPVSLTAGGTTGSRPPRYEAEDAAFSGTITIGSDVSASNGQFLNMRNDGMITWTVENIPAAGIYDMTIGFKLAYGSPKTQYLSVNGGPQTEIAFSGDTGIWLENTVQVFLESGSNSIQLDGYWSWMYFDYIELNLPVLCAYGDLNLDCQVDMNDLMILVAGWMNPYEMADMADISADWSF